MKKGIIIYSSDDVDKNRRFIELCKAGLSDVGVELELMILDDKIQIDTDSIIDLKDVVVAINRSRSTVVAKKLEESGVRVFNNSRITDICNDKWTTYKYAKEIGIPVMDTVLVDGEAGDDAGRCVSGTDSDSNKSVYSKACEIQYPRVVKSLAGHGGSEVFLVANEDEEKAAAGKIGGAYVVQRLADAKGRDIRVYAIGSEIIVAMCRSAKDGFKSNFSLGGKSEIYILNNEEKKLVERVIVDLKADYVGVDLIYDGNRLVLNEIEDAVGARMVYANTNIPIIEKYIDYVICEIKDLL